MDPLSTARYGMMAAESRLAASAARLAGTAGQDEVGDAHETVEQIEAKAQFAANAQVATVADAMWRDLLDVQADARL